MAGSGNRLPGSGSISSDFIAHTDSSTSTPSPPHAIANPALLFTGPRYNSTSQYISHYYGNIPTRGYHPTCTTDIIQHVDGLFMADSSLRKVVEKYPELLQKISQTIDNVVSWEFKQNPYMNRYVRKLSRQHSLMYPGSTAPIYCFAKSQRRTTIPWLYALSRSPLCVSKIIPLSYFCFNAAKNSLHKSSVGLTHLMIHITCFGECSLGFIFRRGHCLPGNFRKR